MAEPTVELLAYTPDPERVVAVAARRSYSRRPAKELWDELGDQEVSELLGRVIRQRHLSVLEHASFTFAIEGVSRAVSHQLVRHRIASYTQQSQQRVSEQHLEFVVPSEIEDDPVLVREFEETMTNLKRVYQKMLDRGIRKGQARYILPNACKTKLIMTMNARSLFNVISQRACGVEEWELRALATKIHEVLMIIAPNIFKYAGPPCVTELVCYEGQKGEKCGRYKMIPGAVLRDGFHRNARDELDKILRESSTRKR